MSYSCHNFKVLEPPLRLKQDLQGTVLHVQLRHLHPADVLDPTADLREKEAEATTRYGRLLRCPRRSGYKSRHPPAAATHLLKSIFKRLEVNHQLQDLDALVGNQHQLVDALIHLVVQRGGQLQGIPERRGGPTGGQGPQSCPTCQHNADAAGSRSASQTQGREGEGRMNKRGCFSSEPCGSHSARPGGASPPSGSRQRREGHRQAWPVPPASHLHALAISGEEGSGASPLSVATLP